MFIIPGIREPGTRPDRKQRGTELSWAAPIDNEHVRGISIVAWALENGAPKLDCEHSTDTIADIRPGSSLHSTRSTLCATVDEQAHPDAWIRILSPAGPAALSYDEDLQLAATLVGATIPADGHLML